MVRKILLAAREVEDGPEIEEINGDGDRPLMIHHNPLVPVNIGGRDWTDQQTELFYANCLICGRRVKFVIDNGSNTNLIAQRLIWDLQLHRTNGVTIPIVMDNRWPWGNRPWTMFNST